jgi:hypothetical protein
VVTVRGGSGGDGKGRGVGPQLLLHQPRWMTGAVTARVVASGLSCLFTSRGG